MKTASAHVRGGSDAASKRNSFGTSPLNRWVLACIAIACSGFADPSFALQAPAVSKVFSPSTVAIGTPSTMTITLTNPNAGSAISNVVFVDTYPAGMLNAIVNPVLGNTCGGTVTAAPNDVSASLSGGAIPASGSCQVSISVAGTAVGSHTNATGAVQSSNAPPGPSASGVLNVTGGAGDIAIAQTSPASTVPPNTPFAFSAVVTNLGASPVYGALFLEHWRANFTTTSVSCTGSTTGRSVCPAAGVSTLANLQSTGIPVPVLFPGEGVTFKVTGTSGPVPGTYAAFYGVVYLPAGMGDTNSLDNGTTSTIEIVDIAPVLSLAKTASAPLFSNGGTYTYTLIVTNNGAVQTTGPLQITDNLPPGVGYLSAIGSDVGWTCSGGGSPQICTYNPNAPGAAGPLDPGEHTTLKLNVGVSILATSGDNTAIVSGGGSAACSAVPPPSTCTSSVFTGIASLPALTITNTAGSGTFVAGQTGTYTLTVKNQGGVATSGSVFVNDPLPPGLSATSMTGTGWSCDLVAVQCSRASPLSPGASYPDITLSVAVANNAPPILTNTATATGGGDTSCWTPPLAPHCIGTATVTVLGVAPSVSKTFTPSNVQSGDAAKMTISLANAGSQSITGVAFDDVYPPGIQNAGSSVVDQNTCGGNLVTVAGGSELTLSNGLIPVTGCSIVINVVATLTTAGTVTNHTGPVTSDNAQDGADATGTLTIATAGSLAAPAVTKAFQPATVPLGGASLMTIALANPNNQAINGVAFNDVFPSGLINASGSAIVSNTCSGMVTAVPGGNAVGLTGGVIPASGVCNVVVNVVGTAQGNLDNHVGAVTSTNALASADANATLTVNAATVLAAPLVSKTFAPANVAVGQHAQMTIVLTNPAANTQPISGASFADAYPAGIANASSGTIVSDDGGCHGGIVSAPANGASTTLVGGALPVGGSCSIVIDVVGTAPGSHTNNTGAVLSSNAPTNTLGASGTLSVSAPSGPDLTVAKSHIGDLTAGQIDAEYAITVSNSGAGPTTGTVTVVDTIVDTFELTATGFDAPGWNCTLDSSAGRLTCTRSGVGADALAPGASYPDITLRVDVDTAAEGNTATNTVAVSGGGETNTSNDTAQDVASIGAAVPDLVIAMSHAGNFTQGQSDATYTLTVSNSNTGGADSSGQVAVVDVLPVGLTPLSMGGTGWSCPSLAALTCTRSDPLFAGTSYPPITLTVRVDAPPGALTNIATVSGGGETNLANDSASDPTTIIGTTMLAAPVVTKAFSPSSVPLGGASQMTITLSNASAQPIVAAAFTDAYPSGMANATNGALVSNSCGGVATASDGGNAASLTNGTIPANGTCSLIVDVVATAVAPTSLDNHVGAVSSANALASPDADAVLTVTGATTLAAPVVTKAFSPSNLSVGDHSRMTIALTNPLANTQAIAGVSLTDAYPPGMANAASGVIISDNNGCTGGSVAALPNGNSMSLAGGTLPPGGGCSIVIDVVATASGDHVNATGPIASSNAAPNTTGANAMLSVAGAASGPDLAIIKTHAGDFSQGQSNAQYTLTVSNIGSLPTSGTVTVTDALPIGLSVQSIGGPGWHCSLVPGIPCTRSNPLDPGMSYPPITLAVFVAANAPPSVTNHATVAGGGDINTANNTAGDLTTIVPGTIDLSISKTHSGSFSQGGTGAYTISVSNVGALPTNGSIVSVSDTLPAGLTATAIGGGGTWSCTLATLTCTRSDVLAPAQSYPPITLTVDVAPTATGTLTNRATVSGGGQSNNANDTADDPTVIDSATSPPPQRLAVDDAFYVNAADVFDTTTPSTGDALHNGYRSVLANDQPQGLVAMLVAPPSHGSVTLADDGTLVYHNADAPTTSGSDTFTYRACDSASPATCSAAATVFVTVLPQGQTPPPPANPPVAVDDAAIVAPGGLLDTGANPPAGAFIGGHTSVLDNDAGQGLQATVLSTPAHIASPADFSLAADGTLHYKNGNDGATRDTFSYEACDSAHTCAGAIVTLTIGTGLTDHAPVAVDDLLQVTPGVTLDTTPAGGDTLIGGAASVLSNDTDEDTASGDSLIAKLLTYPSFSTAPPFALNADGTLIYESDVAANDSFVYETCDSFGACAPAIVSAWVTTAPPDNLPVAVGDQIQVSAGGTANTLSDGHASLLFNDQDADPGEQATLTAHLLVGSGPAHGTAIVHDDGTFSYTNDGSSATTDRFDYEACDIHGGCSRAIVAIGVGTGSVPTVACQLPTQTYVVGASGAPVDIDLAPLFTPPAGDTLVYSFVGLPTPPFSIDPGNHLVARLLEGDIGVYEATLTATTSQPPPLSASEDVTFVVLSASEVLLRDGFDGGLVPQPCP